MPPALFFSLRIALAIWGLSWFYINFMIICSNSVKNVMGNLIEIALNLYIALVSIAILTILKGMGWLSISFNHLQFHLLCNSQYVSFPTPW